MRLEGSETYIPTRHTPNHFPLVVSALFMSNNATRKKIKDKDPKATSAKSDSELSSSFTLSYVCEVDVLTSSKTERQ